MNGSPRTRMDGPPSLTGQGWLRSFSQRFASVLGFAAILATPVEAQNGATPLPPVSATGAAQAVDLLVVAERPWTPAVTVTMSFDRGSGEDPEGAEGTTWLLAMALTETANRDLADMGARVAIDVSPGETRVTLFATPGDWPSAFTVLAEALFSREVGASVAEASREDLLAQLEFQRGAPVRSFEVETERLLLGAFHPQSRSRTGTVESVSAVGLADLVGMQGRIFAADRASVAVVGAVSAVGVTDVVTSGSTVVSPAVPGSVEPVAAAVEDAVSDAVADSLAEPVSTGPEAAAAWTEGQRHTIADDVTNTWIAAAYPLATDSSRTDVEFFAHVLERELGPTPPPPGLFHVSVEVRDLQAGPVVLVVAAVETRSAAAWERRITNVVAGLAAGPMTKLYFDQHRRSFRSLTALGLSTPEVEGWRLLADVRRNGHVRSVPAEVAALSTDRLQRVALMVGLPRLLVFGPGGTRGGQD